MKWNNSILAIGLGFIVSQQGYATNGYFSHGYGVKSQAMGGVGIALPQDSIAAATNPAGMGLIGDRLDLGLVLFRPHRDATLENTAGGTGALDGSFSGNGRENFIIPEGGYNRVLSQDFTLGVSVYGNGGMNSDYEQPIGLLSGASGNLSGIDYMQLFIAPTVTWKPFINHTLGLSLNLGYQRFKAKGIDNFSAISVDPTSVTGVGADDAYGIGVHLGWIGQFSDAFTMGLSYQSRTHFGRFDKYRGLFADEGAMDAPANFGVGIALNVTPEFTLALDVKRILFSDVPAVGNTISLWNGQPFIDGGAGNLGDKDGPGFGWNDSTVIKIGLSYDYSDSLTLRAGYNHNQQPIPDSEALFNILAPGVIQDHMTFGFTWTLSSGGEVSASYTHAFKDGVNGPNAVPAQFGGGNVGIEMHQNMFGLAYGFKF